MYTCLFFGSTKQVQANSWSSRFNAINILSILIAGVSDSWDHDHTSFAFYSCEEKNGTFLNKETFVHGPRFKSIFSGVGRFPVVNIQLSDDVVLIQKPARCVPMSLKDKFEQEIHSMENQGIISKLDHNQATQWLNSFGVVKKPSSDTGISLDSTDLKCL